MKNQVPEASNDAEIIIVDDSVGVTDATHRPASAASRKAAEKQLAKEAELRELLEKMKSNDGATNS